MYYLIYNISKYYIIIIYILYNLYWNFISIKVIITDISDLKLNILKYILRFSFNSTTCML